MASPPTPAKPTGLPKQPGNTVPVAATTFPLPFPQSVPISIGKDRKLLFILVQDARGRRIGFIMVRIWIIILVVGKLSIVTRFLLLVKKEVKLRGWDRIFWVWRVSERH